jgi:hypothetical protein
MLKDLSTTILEHLRKHPMSARQLAKAMQRRAEDISRTCRRWHRDGFIRRDRQRWIFVTAQGAEVKYTTNWDVETARAEVTGRSCTPLEYLDPDDPTVVGRMVVRLREARAYLERQDPDFLAQADRERATLIQCLSAVRTAAHHDRSTFRALCERLTTEHHGAVGHLVPRDPFHRFEVSLTDEMGWLDWVAHGQQPNPMKGSTFVYPDRAPVPPKAGDVLTTVRRIVESEEAYDDSAALWLTRMCLVADQVGFIQTWHSVVDETIEEIGTWDQPENAHE